MSFGYGGTAKASTDLKFTDYGEKFTAGDVITAYIVRITTIIIDFLVIVVSVCNVFTIMILLKQIIKAILG